MKIGYARVSTTDQNLDRQLDSLKAAGAERILTEKVSGAKKDRPELQNLLNMAREDDTVIVTELSRLGRNTAHLLSIAEDLKQRGIQLVSLKEGLDSGTATGQLMFTMFAALAQFERDLSRERAEEGRTAAKARGRSGGRPSILTPAKRKLLKTLSEDKNTPVQEICETLGISRATYYRELNLLNEVAA